MSVVSGDLGEVTGGHVKIGAESHAARNVGILVGAVAVGAAIFGVASYMNRQDTTRLAQLETFRAAFADKCEAPLFRGESSALLKDTYLKSERLQAAVERQQSALQSGVPCEEITRALRAADFPMAAPTSSQQ